MENFTSFGPLPGTGWQQPYTPDFSRINLTPQDLVIGKHRCRQALRWRVFLTGTGPMISLLKCR